MLPHHLHETTTGELPLPTNVAKRTKVEIHEVDVFNIKNKLIFDENKPIQSYLTSSKSILDALREEEFDREMQKANRESPISSRTQQEEIDSTSQLSYNKKVSPKKTKRKATEIYTPLGSLPTASANMEVHKND